MPITSTNLVFRRAALVSDTTATQNGGRMTSSAIVSDAKNNLFPDVSQAQRVAGAEHFRKLFMHVANADNDALLNARVFLEDITPGDGFLLLYQVGQADVQSDLVGRPYGVGRLAAAVGVEATSLVVGFEHPSMSTTRPVRSGDLVRVANIAATGGNGVEALATVDNVTWAGAQATVTLTAPLGQAFDPAAGPVTVSSCITQAEVKASASPSNASWNPAGSLLLTNKGTIYQTWTLTFTSPTEFRLDGDSLGASVATGTTSADFAPAPAGGVPFFTMPASAWVGTWAAGNWLQFSTSPAAIPLFLQRVTPAGAGSVTNDGAYLGVQGEAA